MFVPDPGSEFFPSRIRIKEFSYFNPKKMVSKLSEIGSGLFISAGSPDPDLDPDFSTSPPQKTVFHPTSQTRYHHH
jgi:hypothetical protein